MALIPIRLTPLRWIAAAIVGCLAAAVLIVRTDELTSRHLAERWELRSVMDRHGAHASNAARQLRTVTLLDSLGLAVPVTTATAALPRVRIVRDPALPDDVGTALLSLAERAVRQVPDSMGTGTGTDIVLVYDTLSQIHGASIRGSGVTVDFVLPQAPNERCVALVHVGRDASNRRQLFGVFRSAPAAWQLIGPCAYYRAFGIPGRGVNSWLQTRGWTFAGEGSWERAEPSLALSSSGLSDVQSSIERAVFGQTTLPFHFEMKLDGTRCAAGQTDVCERILLVPQGRSLSTIIARRVVLPSFSVLRSEPYWYPRRTLGHREAALLAGMVRTLGRDRFARFWRSDEPAAAAFQHAAGESMGVWSATWADSTYGAVPPRGAGVSPWGAVMSVALMLLAFLITLRLSERRQFA